MDENVGIKYENITLFLLSLSMSKFKRRSGNCIIFLLKKSNPDSFIKLIFFSDLPPELQEMFDRLYERTTDSFPGLEQLLNKEGWSKLEFSLEFRSIKLWRNTEFFNSTGVK